MITDCFRALLDAHLTVPLFTLFHQTREVLTTLLVMISPCLGVPRGFVLFSVHVHFLFPPSIAAFRNGWYLKC